MAGGYWEHIATLSALNAIMALGFYVTFLTGQLSAAHGAFIGIGAYGAGMLATKFAAPYPLGVVAGAAIAAVAAAVVASALRRLSGMFLAIGTLAASEILIVVVKNTPSLGGALGISGIPLRTTIWIALLVLAAVALGLHMLEKAGVGLAFRAVRDDAKAASAIGIDVARTRVVAFACGGFLCGLGGALQVHYLGVMEPDELGFATSVALILFTIVGGRDYFLGPIFGAVLFTVLPELLRVSARGRLAIFSVLLVLLVILRPDGFVRRPLFLSRGGGEVRPDGTDAGASGSAPGIGPK